MTVCRNCGAQSPDGSPYCRSCGMRIAPYTEEETRKYVESLRAATAPVGDADDSRRAPARQTSETLSICANCLYQGSPVKRTRGSTWTELLLWSFLVPGIIYTIWRWKGRQAVCPVCGKPGMIPVDSPVGQHLLKYAVRSTLESGAQPGASAPPPHLLPHDK